MTIQQQLQTLGPSFEVDGVEWGVFNSVAIHTYIPSIGTIQFTFGYKGLGSLFLECNRLGIEMQIFSAATLADACRQALQLCRERVAELAGALGMAVYDDEPSGAGLRNHLLKHPDRQKVEDACRHRLGGKQKAVDFAEWMNENRYVKYWGSSGENCNKWYQSYTPPNRPYYTTEELYNLFINQPRAKRN